MKTTIRLSDDLAHRARELACRERRTLRSLVEEGLHLVLDRHRREEAPIVPFKLKDGSFRGNGLTPEAAAGGWMRNVYGSYGDRT